MMRVLPSIVTLAGLTYGVAALTVGAPHLAALFAAISLALDVADGALARALHAESEFGAMLDWSSDTTLALALVLKLWGFSVAGIVAMVALVLWQATHAALDLIPHKSSGRALLWAPWICWLLLP